MTKSKNLKWAAALLLVAVMALSAVSVCLTSRAAYEKSESKINGIGFYYKQAGVNAEVYVSKDSYAGWVGDWSGTQYVALEINQPTAAGWPLAVNVYDEDGGVSFLNTGDPTATVDAYNTSFEKISAVNAGYASVWTVPDTAQWLLFTASDMGIASLDLSKISMVRFAFDLVNNQGLQMEIGEMRIFAEQPNSDFSNGTTVLNPAAMTDEQMQAAYILTAGQDILFTDYMDVKRVNIKEPIVLEKADSYQTGIRVKVLKQGEAAYHLQIKGNVTDLSSAKYFVFDVSNTTAAEVPFMPLGGNYTVGTTGGISGEKAIALTWDNNADEARVQYGNVWIPANFCGKIIVPIEQFAGTFDWAHTDIMILNIDAVNNPAYSLDISSIGYIEKEVADFTALEDGDIKTYFDAVAIADDNELIDKFGFAGCTFGDSLGILRTEANIDKPVPPEPIVLDKADSYQAGIRVQVLKKGETAYQLQIAGNVTDLSAAKYMVFEVANTEAKEKPFMPLGGQIGVGTTTGITGTEVPTLAWDNKQGTARVQYNNIWIPANFCGKIIVPIGQFGGDFSWTDADLMIIHIDAVNYATYSLDISSIGYIEKEIEDFTALEDGDIKTYFDSTAVTDDELIGKFGFVNCVLGDSLGILRTESKIDKPATPDIPDEPENVELKKESSYMKGIRIKAIKQGTFQVWFYGSTEDLSAAKYIGIDVSNPYAKEVPVLLAAGNSEVGTTAGFTGDSVIAVSDDNKQSTARVQYGNVWIPAKFAGRIIVPVEQIAAYDAIDWSDVEFMLVSIDAVTNPGYVLDLSGICYAEQEISDFTVLGADVWKSYFNPESFESDTELIKNVKIVGGIRDTHVEILRVDGELERPSDTPPENVDPSKPTETKSKKGCKGCKSEAGSQAAASATLLLILAGGGMLLYKKGQSLK